MIHLMTLLIFFIIAVTIISVIWISQRMQRKTNLIITLVIGAVFLFVAYVTVNTASFKRSMKDLNSEFNENIEREITVHSRSGEIIHQSEGKFDIEFLDNRLKWIDEDNKVHIIYLGDSATAIVEEIGNE